MTILIHNLSLFFFIPKEKEGFLHTIDNNENDSYNTFKMNTVVCDVGKLVGKSHVLEVISVLFNCLNLVLRNES